MSDIIIFLDFDGVLNTEHYQNFLYHEGKPWQDEHGAFSTLKPLCNYVASSMPPMQTSW